VIALGLAAATAVLLVLSGGSLKPRSATAVARHDIGSPALGVRTARPSRALAGLEAIGNARVRRLAQLGRPLFCGGPRGHAVAFTFDDGPGVYTYLALRKLRQAHQRATFFVVGNSMNHFPGYLPRELAVAAVGDHTYTHPDLAMLPAAQVYSELERTKLQIQHATGGPVALFRPPYGALNPTVTETARRLGLLTVMWTADSQDSLGANYAGIIRNVKAALHPGAIILMHENRGQTIRALTTLLPILHRRHLSSVSIPELLATDPPSVAQLLKGRAACGATGVSRGAH
jgi:peptidoglycan/xylan/chitin deacetylase (PgdA/CDA1 family)